MKKLLLTSVVMLSIFVEAEEKVFILEEDVIENTTIKGKKITDKQMEELAINISLNNLKQGTPFKAIEKIASQEVKEKDLSVSPREAAKKILDNIMSKRDEAAGVFRFHLSPETTESLLKFSKTKDGKEWFDKASAISNEVSPIVMDAIKDEIEKLEKKYGKKKSEADDKNKADTEDSNNAYKKDVKKESSKDDKKLEELVSIISLEPLKQGPSLKIIELVVTNTIKDKDLSVSEKEATKKVIDSIMNKKPEVAAVFKKNLSSEVIDALLKFSKTVEGKEWFEKVGEISQNMSIIIMDAIKEEVEKLEEKYGKKKPVSKDSKKDEKKEYKNSK